MVGIIFAVSVQFPGSHSRDIHVSLMCDFNLIIDINVSVSVCLSK